MRVQLTHIDSEGFAEILARGTLAELTSPNCPELRRVCQVEGRAEWAARDLSRLGARYHEFEGGALVVSFID